MNQIQTSFNINYAPFVYLEEAIKGLEYFFEQEISEIAWQILSRSTLKLYNFCSMVRISLPICKLPGLSSLLFRFLLPTAIYSMDYLLFKWNAPQKTTIDPPNLYHSIVDSGEEFTGTLLSEISCLTSRLPSESYNLQAQLHLYSFLSTSNFLTFFHKVYAFGTEKITRLFFESVEQNNTAVMEKLFDHPLLNFKARDKGDMTFVHITAMYGEPYISKAIQKTSLFSNNLNRPDRRNARPLHYAMYKSRVDSINTLLSAKADVNAPNVDNNTPLHFAVYACCLGCIKALAKDPKLNWNAVNDLKMTAIKIAASSKFVAIVKYLLTIKKVHFTPSSLIADAITKNAIELLKIYQNDSRFDFSAINNPKNKETFLHQAVRVGQLEICDFLSSLPSINLSAKNNKGQTAYDLAIEYKRDELATLLNIRNADRALLLTKQKLVAEALKSLNQALDCLESERFCKSELVQLNKTADQLNAHFNHSISDNSN